MTKNWVGSIRAAVLAAGCTLLLPGAVVAQTKDAPASLAGTWNMSLIGDHVIPVALVLEQNGSVLKGTFIMMGKDFPLAGELVDGKFTLTGKGPAFGRPGGDHNAGANPALAEMTIAGAADADNLAGNLVIKATDSNPVTLKWTAERLKERNVPAASASAPMPADLSGKWTMRIVEAQLDLAVELKQDGSKVTGTATSEHLGVMAVDGTVANGTLSFVATGAVSGQDVKIEFSGKSGKDGALFGDLTSQMGAMTWTAARVRK